MEVIVNGSPTTLDPNASVADLIAELGLSEKRIAIELNREILPRQYFEQKRLESGDRIEIVHAIGGGQDEDPLRVGPYTFHSRLLVGTGKYRDFEETRLAIEASGAELVTVAIRRTNIGQNPGDENLLDVLPPERYTILPNTAGCYCIDDALRTCHLARELLDGRGLVKLEVLGDEKTLFPNVIQTVEAARRLVEDGFEVMVYTNDDPIVAKELEAIGCIAVMPLAAPIGSGLGIRNPYNILTIIENARVPIIVDAGVGTASDAAIAMELGCDGVLMNTAIAAAQKPVLMAAAMNKAVAAGREAFLAGRMPRRRYASASSPIEGLFF
ncbi:MAG: sulfur carrier protein ThiS [Gammaproteobacteria bacterium]